MGSELKDDATPTLNHKMLWRNSDSETLGDHDLRGISRSWDSDQWEQYLSTLEVRPSETLLSDPEFQRAIDKQTESIFALARRSCSREDSSIVWTAMTLLTPRQREVIHLIYWKNASEREVSQMLGISRATVRTLHKRGLRKLRGQLETREEANRSSDV